MPEFMENITNELIQQLRQSHFIKKCMDQSIKRNQLDNFITQHAWYSRQFTRYLCSHG